MEHNLLPVKSHGQIAGDPPFAKSTLRVSHYVAANMRYDYASAGLIFISVLIEVLAYANEAWLLAH